MPTDLEVALRHAIDLLQRPFWTHGEFWIFLALGAGSLIASIKAFGEARQAKRAATLAGRTVKLQTVAIELNEVSHKLDELDMGIQFNEARDLLSEASKRVRRAVSPFAEDVDLSAPIAAVLNALKAAQASLKAVRPTDPGKEQEGLNLIYYAIEDNFATINDGIADLLGLFEKQTFDFGDEHAGAGKPRTPELS